NGHADAGRLQAELGRDLGDLTERSFQVLVDVDGERFEWGHVDDVGSLGEKSRLVVGPVETIDADQEGGEGLPGTRGSRDQRVTPRGDLGPPVRLRWGGAVGEPAGEPCAEHGVK